MQIHGHNVDKIKGRFSGTIDEIDEDDFRFDRVVIMVVMGRTSLGAVDVKDDGEVHATMKIKVDSMVPLTDSLRDQAIAFMAHGADQGLLDFGNYKHKPPAIEGQEALPVADYAQPPAPPEGVDENGEIQPIHTTPTRARVVQDPDEEFDVPPADPPPVTARPDDVEPPAPTPQAPPAGVRSEPLRSGARKDSVLDSWLNEQ